MEQVMPEKQRRRWSREETIGFLKCYLSRKAEFEHLKKKRLAYSNVLKDMVSLKITDSERTPVCLESKMRTLLHAYKSAQDNNRSTSASACFAPYKKLMDEIFSTNPIISNNHTLHVGYRSFQRREVCVASSPPSSSTTTALSPQSSPLLVLPSSSSTTTVLSPQSSPLLVLPPSPSIDLENQSTSALAPSSSSSSSPIVRRKRSAREIYYEKKLKLRKLEAEEKKKVRSNAIEELKNMLREKWQKDRQLESKKVALLEKIANRK